MNNKELNEKAIFKAAFNIPSAEAREDFLAAACEDAAMLNRVRMLLRQAAEDSEFLESPPAQVKILETVGDQKEIGIEQIGPYRIREKIGEGGMGVVYVAEQTEPVQRKVAIKVIKPGMDTKEVIARFEAERQALAFMEHPNIARVLDAGATESGRSYFVMELVRGIPITEYCDQVKATPRERLDLFQTVCDAVQHAHQKGIIHRDIKPSNVLVTQVGTKPVVKVIDFGLAKVTSGQKLTDKTVYTGFMKLMGTPAYMSPEQAGLSGLDIDTRSDVYSLGILLYELLTGTTPLDKTEIQKQAYDELFRQIREVEAPKPSSRISTLKDAERSTIAQQRGVEPKNLRQLLDGDLDVVVLKALEKDRDRRYSSPQDLAADVDRFLADQPVLAVPPSSIYLARKYFRRHRFAILTAAAMAVALLVAAGVSTWQAVRASREATRANQFAKEVVVARDAAIDAGRREQQVSQRRRREVYAAKMRTADRVWNDYYGDARRVEDLLAAWIPVDAQEDLRDFSWRYQWTRLHKNSQLTVRDVLGATVNSAGNLITASPTGLQLWNGDVSETIWTDDASNVIFSPDGRWAAIALGDSTALFEMESQETVMAVPYLHCNFSPQAKFFIAWKEGSHTADVWDISGDSPTQLESVAIQGDKGLPNASANLQLASDRSLLLVDSGSEARLLRPGVKPISIHHRMTDAPYAWSPNAQFYAAQFRSGGYWALELRDTLAQKGIRKSGRGIHCFQFSPDGTRLAIGDEGGVVDIYDTSKFLEFSESELVRDAAIRDSRVQAFENEIQLELGLSGAVSKYTPRRLSSTKAHLGVIKSIRFSSDGSKMATYADDLADDPRLQSTSSGVAKLWDVDRISDLKDQNYTAEFDVAEFGDEKEQFNGRLGMKFDVTDRGPKVNRILGYYHHPVKGDLRVGDTIVSASDSRGEVDLAGKTRSEVRRLFKGPASSNVRVVVEDAEGRRRNVELKRHKAGGAMGLRFSSDSQTIVVSGESGASSINLATGKTRRYPAVSGPLAISKGGLLALADSEEVLIWNLKTDQEVKRIEGRVPANQLLPGGRYILALGLAFSPDGKFLALAQSTYPTNISPQACLKVWRTDDFNEVQAQLYENDSAWCHINFTPDNSRLLAADRAGVLRSWDTKTWKMLEQRLAVSDHGQGLLHSLALSPDGKLFDAGGQLFELETGKKLHRVSPASLLVTKTAFSPDNRTLVKGSSEYGLVLWDLKTGSQLQTVQAATDHTRLGNAIFSPDGNTLACLTGDSRRIALESESKLRLWKAASIPEIESDPLMLDSLHRLAVGRNRSKRYAEAEAILRRLLELQQKELRADHPDIGRTKSELEVAQAGQGKSPDIPGHPPPD